MNSQNHAYEKLLPFAFMAIALIGYFSLAFVSGNYLDALSIPLLVGFIWVGVFKQQFALAIALVAVFILLAIPAMVAGFMHFSTLNSIIMVVVSYALGVGIYRLSLGKTIAMFIFFFLSITLLYTFDYLESDKFVILMVGGSAGMLGTVLFATKRLNTLTE